MAAAGELTESQWQAHISWGAAGRDGEAAFVPWLRRVEVEVHHVDLDLDYTLRTGRRTSSSGCSPRRRPDFSARDGVAAFTLIGNEDQGRWDVGGGGQEINGPPPALLGWLIGRTDGHRPAYGRTPSRHRSVAMSYRGNVQPGSPGDA